MSQIYVPNNGLSPLGGEILFNADSGTFAETNNSEVTIVGGTGIQVLGDDNNTLTINFTGSSGGSPATPLKIITDFDDFISSGEISKLDWAFLGVFKHEGTTSNPGQLVGSGGGISLICFSVATDLGNPWQLGGGTLSNSWVLDLVTLSSAPNRYIYYIGISDNTDAWGTGNAINGCFFKYSDNINSGNWQLVSVKAGVTTTVNTAIPATTGFHNYTVSVDATATLATFYIDGVPIGTIATNIPLQPLGPTINAEATVGVLPAFLIDLWYYTQNLTSARPGDQGGGGGGGGGAPGTGNVTGPGVSTDNALVRWDGVTGTVIQDSVANLTDAGALSGLTGLSSGGTIILAGPVSGLTSLSVSGPTTLNGGQFVKITTATGATYTTLASDFVILVNGVVTSTIQPLGGPTTGQMYRIKDSAGTAAANNITITPSGKNIDGAASYVINNNYGSVDIVYNGVEWNKF